MDDEERRVHEEAMVRAQFEARVLAILEEVQRDQKAIRLKLQNIEQEGCKYGAVTRERLSSLRWSFGLIAGLVASVVSVVLSYLLRHA